MLTIRGKVTLISTENDKQTMTISNEFTTKQFNLQDTYLFDAVTGYRLQLEEMLDREVTVYAKEQTAAAVVTVSDTGIANYAEIEAAAVLEDGNLQVVTDDGSRIVTISKEAEIRPWLTRNIVMLPDIQTGCKVILYYDLLTMSLPAQAYTEKVILLAQK